MKLTMIVLQHPKTVRKHLQQDGWILESQNGNLFSVSHQEVKTEPDARQRLYAAGLLTSSAVAIEFPLSPSR
jgi:hypothetical protein